MKKPGTYIDYHVKPHLCTKFGDSSLKNEFRNAKRVRLIKWSIMRIFNEAEPPMIELVRDLRTINVLAKFENDPWKIMDVRVLTVIFHVRSWKMRKKIAKIFFLANMKKPGTYIDYHVKPHLCTKFGDSSLKNEFRNAKRVRLIKWSIMRIFNEAEPPWSNLSEILGQ